MKYFILDTWLISLSRNTIYIFFDIRKKKEISHYYLRNKALIDLYFNISTLVLGLKIVFIFKTLKFLFKRKWRVLFFWHFQFKYVESNRYHWLVTLSWSPTSYLFQPFQLFLKTVFDHVLFQPIKFIISTFSRILSWYGELCRTKPDALNMR
jgi:hypothetical protein